MKNFLQTILYVSTTILLASLTTCTTQPKGNDQAPNIIYIFPDQFRNSAMHFWDEPEFKEAHIKADPVVTPHLDQFAKEALVSTCAVSNSPLSIHYYGSLMTGMYPHKHEFPNNSKSNQSSSLRHKNTVFLSDVLHHSGYECAYILPERRHGFNFWYTDGTYATTHKDSLYWDDEGKRHVSKEWSPIHEAKVAIKYLQNKEGQRDPSKPFFMMIGMNPPHASYGSRDDCLELEKDYNLYKDKSIKDLLVRPNADKLRKNAQSAQSYFASITGIDRAFGMIMNELHILGLDKNTIVVFTSDCGNMMYSHNTDNAKDLPYTEAMNVPFMVRYPQHIRPRMENFMISTPDIMPTILGLSNLQNSIPETVQGYNYARLLTESDINILNNPECALYLKDASANRDSVGKVISYFPMGRGIKTPHYTLAFFIDKNYTLKKTVFFNDVTDPYQLHNLPLENHPRAVRKLVQMMGIELQRIEDPWFEKKILSDKIPYAKEDGYE